MLPNIQKSGEEDQESQESVGEHRPRSTLWKDTLTKSKM